MFAPGRRRVAVAVGVKYWLEKPLTGAGAVAGSGFLAAAGAGVSTFAGFSFLVAAFSAFAASAFTSVAAGLAASALGAGWLAGMAFAAGVASNSYAYSDFLPKPNIFPKKPNIPPNMFLRKPNIV